MKTTSTIATAIALGLTLSGCQMLLGPRSAEVDSSQGTRLADQQPEANPALEQGKQLLRAGRIAQAVDLLRVAQRDPASMAEASNALGVAYAKLGRHDLADRYFRMALSLDPAERRFAANMLRLQRDHNLAMRRNEEAAQLALKAREEKRLAEAQAASPGRLQRLSRGFVEIRTQASPRSLAPQMEVLAMHKPAARTKPVGGSAEADRPEEGQANRQSRSATIDFGAEAAQPSSKSVTVPSTGDAGAYPVRVFIGA